MLSGEKTNSMTQYHSSIY